MTLFVLFPASGYLGNPQTLQTKGKRKMTNRPCFYRPPPPTCILLYARSLDPFFLRSYLPPVARGQKSKVTSRCCSLPGQFNLRPVRQNHLEHRELIHSIAGFLRPQGDLLLSCQLANVILLGPGRLLIINICVRRGTCHKKQDKGGKSCQTQPPG